MMPWATITDVTNQLGAAPTVPADIAALDAATAAANDWAVRRRATSGYVDDPDVAPDAAVTLGVALYAVALYRERGSADSYPSFEELAAFAPVGNSGQIRRLLGIDRPAVDAPPAVAP